MKTSKTSMLILAAGLLFYAVTYIATSVTEKIPLCYSGNFNYKTDSSIRRSFEQLPGYIEHRIYGNSCDSMYVLFLDSVNRNFSYVGDSICSIVKRNGYTLKGALVTKIDTSILNRRIDTLYTYKCS